MSFLFEVDPKEKAAADLIQDVGRKLQQFCVAQGITQADIAERLSVNKSHVSRSLSGFNNMTLRTLAEIALALDGVIHIGIGPKVQSLETPSAPLANNVISFSSVQTMGSVANDANSTVFDERFLDQIAVRYAR